MKILGIDPGSGRIGWGVVTILHGKVSVVAYGCIETSAKLSVEARLEVLYNELTTIIKENKPEALSIEELFFNKNVTTALLVGQARGVILLAAAQYKLPISSYTPSQVKVAVAGYGGAMKNQVGQMVKTILQLQSIPKPDDTADALAIALTHAFSARYPKK